MRLEEKVNEKLKAAMKSKDKISLESLRLIKSEILISSGNASVDKMAIDILEKAAPFAPFDPQMLNEYGILEIIRDWNFNPR